MSYLVNNCEELHLYECSNNDLIEELELAIPLSEEQCIQLEEVIKESRRRSE